jgi:hypothetical protein
MIQTLHETLAISPIFLGSWHWQFFQFQDPTERKRDRLKSLWIQHPPHQIFIPTST